MNWTIEEDVNQSAVIKVVGVGGGGGNAVQHMVASGIEGVDFVAINTDAQVLKKINARTTLQIGGNLTRGLGAGSNPETGKQAALEDRDAWKRCCAAVTWCSSPPVWAAAPVPVPHRWSRKSRKNSTCWWWRW